MKKLLNLGLSLFMILNLATSPANATESSQPKEMTVYTTDLDGNLLSINGIPIKNEVEDEAMMNISNIESRNAFGVSQRNTRKVGEYRGSNAIYQGSGSGGGTIELSTSATSSTTISGGFGISAGEFNANMGFASTSSITLGIRYSYYIPTSVRRATVKAFPRYYIYNFDCYFLEMYNSTGTAHVPRGIDYVVYHY